MAKPKYMTTDNYLEFKPSEFVRSFVADVEVAIRKKLPMNMDKYVSDDPKYLPCLGGLACMNFGYKSAKGTTYRGTVGSIPDFVENLGDDLRFGYGRNVMHWLQQLYPGLKLPSILPTHSKSFIGIQGPKQLKELQKRIYHYADLIEAAGY